MKIKPIPISSVILVQFLSCTISLAQQCKSRESHFGYRLLSSTYKWMAVENLGKCHEKCVGDQVCSSINYDLLDGICELNLANKEFYPVAFVPQEHWIHMESRKPAHGSNKMLAVSSCKRILEIRPKVTSGVYWIKIGNGSNQTSPFQVYCDMTTDGGGWTLVYSYHFTNFANFDQDSNAVTPIPTWPVKLNEGTWVPRSTTVPLNENFYSAMNFTLWKEIGTEFLVKPNITHWISCKPGTGDLVNWKAGTLTCKNVKNVAKVCLGYAPTELRIHTGCGPGLFRNGKFSLQFDGRTDLCWPVHDSCGTTSAANHLTNITTPGGAMYIR